MSNRDTTSKAFIATINNMWLLDSMVAGILDALIVIYIYILVFIMTSSDFRAPKRTFFL